MSRSHRQIDRGAVGLLVLQRGLLVLAAFLLLVAMLIYSIADYEVPLATVLGRLGLIVLLLAGGAKAIRLLEAGGDVALPGAVGGRRLAGTRLLRARIALTLALGVGAPLAAVAALVATVESGWLIVAFALGLGLPGWAAGASAGRRARPEPEEVWRCWSRSIAASSRPCSPTSWPTWLTTTRP